MKVDVAVDAAGVRTHGDGGVPVVGMQVFFAVRMSHETWTSDREAMAWFTLLGDR
ncbi:hypothetical protein ACLF6K_36815 [Streptomyces xanthophaeus]|uniref:hypothetical protein n=1 Tax=Streptomyces xanthophaeus TaxID=67385 RepID=UPI00398F9D4B